MKVKMFEEQHEIDLEEAINDFLSDFNGNLIQILYSSTSFVDQEEQIFSFSVLILYE